MTKDTVNLFAMDDAPGHAVSRRASGGWNPYDIWRTRIHEPRALRISSRGARDTPPEASPLDSAPSLWLPQPQALQQHTIDSGTVVPVRLVASPP